MSFVKYLYRFDAGSVLVWTLSPGYVYIVKSISMSCSNEANKASSGFMLYCKDINGEYIQYENGLISGSNCVNDRHLTNLNVQMAYGFNPYIGSLNGTLPTRAVCIIEYEMIPQEYFRRDVGLPGARV